jgi:hypothetical protein
MVYTKRSSAEDGEAPALRGRRHVPARERSTFAADAAFRLRLGAGAAGRLSGRPDASVSFRHFAERLPKVTDRKLWDAFRTCGGDDQQA